ncbi:MAG: DUF2232 domain-containing protein [Actinobacteria bacterium]|nr:DUF2232 domain-containing protein [Actinomycetota bacterium]
MKMSEKNNLLDTIRAILLSVFFLYLFFLIPQIWFITFSVLPFPVLYMSVKNGVYSGILLSAFMFIISVVFVGIIPSLLIFVFIALMGIGQSIIITNNFSANKFLYLSVVVIVLCFLITGIFSYAVYKVTVFQAAKKTINISLDEAKKIYIEKEIYKNANLTRSQFEKSFELTKKSAQSLPYMIPSTVILFSGWAILLNMLISQYALKILKLPSSSLSVFSRWQMPWYFAWGFIFGLTLKLFYRYFPFSYIMSSIIGSNLLITFGALFFIQGLCVIYNLFEEKKFSVFKKSFFLSIALFVQFLFQGLTWLGLFDVWFDYRGLLREEANKTGS